MCLPIEDSDERMESQELSFFSPSKPSQGTSIVANPSKRLREEQTYSKPRFPASKANYIL